MIPHVRWRSVGVVVAVSVLAVVVRWVVGHPLTVRTQGMAPGVLRGDTLWISQSDPQAGDVVQVDLGGAFGLYRIVGVDGQVVEVKDKKLFIDGVRVDGSVATTAVMENHSCVLESVPGVRATLNGRAFDFVPGGEDFRVQVKPGTVFVLGDNRSEAADSRLWGAVPMAQIHGVATRVIWSLSPCFSAVRWHRIWNSIE